MNRAIPAIHVSHAKRPVALAMAVCAGLILTFTPSHGQNRSPAFPVGTLSAFPTIVQTGTHPTLTWSVTVPEVVTDLVSKEANTLIATRPVSAGIHILGVSLQREWPEGRAKEIEWLRTEVSVSKAGGAPQVIFSGTGPQVVQNNFSYLQLAEGQSLNLAARFLDPSGKWSVAANSSTGTPNIRALQNGETPPSAFSRQQPESFIAPYLDPQGRIKVGPRTVVYLVELNRADPNDTEYDLQDLAIIVNFYDSLKNNNGHGNNIDGVDASNPGKAPFDDSDAAIDDEMRIRGFRLR